MRDQELKRVYDKMWAMPSARERSPGERVAQHYYKTLKDLGMYAHGQSLVDVGCGTGRAMVQLREWFTVLGVDISPVAPEHGPFVQADIRTQLIMADNVFCCDVLEHLPPEHLDDALFSLQFKVSGFFKIAWNTDDLGPQMGEGDLHLNKQSPEWWHAKFSEQWLVMKHEPGDREQTHQFWVAP